MQKFYSFLAKCARVQKIDEQVIRYIIAGAAINGISYILYLVLTSLGVGHKMAMSSLYIIGMMVNFLVNRRWTFRGTGAVSAGLARFLVAITVGYMLNLIGLFLFVDVAGWPHELVQAGAIVVIAVYFFIINKHYVHAK